MKIFKTKVWSPLDLCLLKGCELMKGMILGAFLASFVKSNLWVFILALVVLAIRPIYSYWIKSD